MNTKAYLFTAFKLYNRIPWRAMLILFLFFIVQSTFAAEVQYPIKVGKPVIHDPVTPKVVDIDLSKLPKTKFWKSGDAVKTMGDLKEVPFNKDGSTAAPSDMGNAGALGTIGTGGVVGPGGTVSFDGVPATGVAPPDPVGDVGPNHYIQMVNISFSIFDKQGNLLAGPSPINTLWAGFGGACETNNNGDPIVRYDEMADRWVMTQFAFFAGFECVAISRTSDPVAGGWYLYAFPTPSTPDYPKIGVWPDGYYMGTQRGFPGGGLDVFAFDRTKMLAGLPAGSVEFNVAAPSLFLMPSDLDGPAPPLGTPNFFTRMVDGEQFGGVDRLEIFEFHVDWGNPAASSFTKVLDLPVQAFNAIMCGNNFIGACVPQPGTTRTLESLPAWAMWRLQFRNFGSYETMVINHTINIDDANHAGIRWYELRRAPAGVWAIAQQGTYAPDEGAPGRADDTHRWMGSIAMDKDGGMALGYTASSATVFPGLRYASRLATDPAGDMSLGENTIVAGGGSQTGTYRWGNYSSMDVDPVDDCTFWYTGEYYAATSTTGWRTRVASFRLPTCGETQGPPQLKNEVGLYIGGLLTDDSLPINAGTAKGFRYRRLQFIPGWSLEAEVGIVSTNDAVDTGKLANLQVNVLRHLPIVTPKVEPFALLGLGAAEYNTLGASDSGLLATLGVGVDYRWTPTISFRLDARVEWLDSVVSSGWTNNTRIIWGPTFSF